MVDRQLNKECDHHLHPDSSQLYRRSLLTITGIVTCGLKIELLIRRLHMCQIFCTCTYIAQSHSNKWGFECLLTAKKFWKNVTLLCRLEGFHSNSGELYNSRTGAWKNGLNLNFENLSSALVAVLPKTWLSVYRSAQQSLLQSSLKSFVLKQASSLRVFPSMRS